ncbi:TRIAD3 protein [Cryptococcus neoformans]|nr:TRIAD3 protein [Cryptococcus neoformans var. grubii Th84]OXH00208.1 TRIAD3 protein [Cryptococcus neoformans var. grubii]OXH21342.1 TRIAD3 protein [Cryptococcus neoformans var. grubii]OXH41121.1 TRIAD3 protein [Cryptococcus neoformans var. grubii]OXH61521.1 TRIAD3 protein [Cryptococcus neoformans var. grubii]
MRPPAASHRDTPHTASSTKQKLRNPGNSNESDSDASIQALEDPPNLVRGRKNAPIIIDGSDSEQDAARIANKMPLGQRRD